MTRMRGAVACAVLIGALSLACRPVSGPPWQQGAAVAEPAEITLVSPRSDQGEDPRIQDFMEQHPDITVLSYSSGGWGRGGDLVERIRQAGEDTGEERGAPDIIYTQVDFLESLGEEDLLLDLSPFMHETGDLTTEAFYSQLIEPMLIGDQVFVLPVSVDPVMLFYNVDMFTKKGVAPPTAEWTWDDLLEAAVRLAEPNAIPPVHGIAVIEVMPFIYQNGGGLVDDPIVPTRFTLDSPDTIDAMQWVMDLEEYYRVSPSFSELQRHEGRAFEMVMGRRVAMWVSSMGFRNYVGSGAVWPFQWGVAPLPEGRTRATEGTVEGVSILKNAPNPRECWEFVRYLVTHLPPGSGPLSQLPALRSLAESQEFLNRMPEENVESYEQSLPYFVPALELPAGVEWQLNQILESSLNPAFVGEISVQDALRQAQEEADRTLTPQLME
jgi:multiple sugar transport system substrate-binding protein